MRKRRHVIPRSLLAPALLGLGGLLRCQPGYSLAPTACDDWCFATQRASCEEDYPEGCVSDCEDSSWGRRVPRCEAAWLELIECYRAAPDSGFLCLEDVSHPAAICVAERVAFATCISPRAGSCVDSCLREVAACAQPERDCEEECQYPSPGCEAAQQALFVCRLSAPPDCPAPEATPRPLEATPCLPETRVLLECAGFPLPDEE